MCKPPQPAVLSQEPLAPWSLLLQVAQPFVTPDTMPIDGGSSSPVDCASATRPPLPAVLDGKVVCSVRAADETQAAAQGTLFLTGASTVPSGVF